MWQAPVARSRRRPDPARRTAPPAECVSGPATAPGCAAGSTCPTVGRPPTRLVPRLRQVGDSNSRDCSNGRPPRRSAPATMRSPDAPQQPSPCSGAALCRAHWSRLGESRNGGSHTCRAAGPAATTRSINTLSRLSSPSPADSAAGAGGPCRWCPARVWRAGQHVVRTPRLTGRGGRLIRTERGTTGHGPDT